MSRSPEMTHDKMTEYHTETIKLASYIVSFAGLLVTGLGATMLFGVDHQGLKSAAAPLMIVWSGVIVFITGRTIRRSGNLLNMPAWSLAGFLLGPVSLYGMLIGLAQNDYVKTVLFLVILMFSGYATWRSCQIGSAEN